jgi:DNA polymerase-3 subunit beta
MKLNITKTELNEAIQHVSRAISPRTTIPILAGIKIDAHADGLTLTASDTDISIQSFIPISKDDRDIVELERAGSVVLPAKFFVEIVRKLPEEQVELEVYEGFRTMIRSGATEIQLHGLDPEEFPVLPVLDESRLFSISSDLLKTMIRQTVFAVSANESTPILTGVLWTLEDNVLKFVATDRHRLASRRVQLDNGDGLTFKNVVISGKTMNELAKLIPEQDTMIDIVVNENQVLFKMDSILFYSRVLDGMYPDTTRIIPEQFKTEIVVETKRLLDAMDRAYLLSREEKTNIVNLNTEENETIVISSSLSELGRITEQCAVEHLQGESLKISFNAKYMLDALKVIDSDQIYLGFNGAMSPILVRPVDDNRLLNLVLPYRTSG